MRKFLLLLLLCQILLGCAITKGTTNPNVKKAIELQQLVINDPLFEKILIELEESGNIHWGEERTEFIKEKLADNRLNSDWLISNYKKKGGFNKDSVFLWRKYNPFSSTTAVTNPCVDQTKLNKWTLTDDEYSLLNTLIHERVHSFCQIHTEEQTRNANQCDASYIAGDLAEALILHKMGFKEREMDKPICPALLKKIIEYQLIIIK